MTTGAITARVERLRRGEDPQLLARLPSGWAILGNHQPDAITGCCMLLPDPVVASVNELSGDARAAFMTDFVRLGDAVLEATGAERVNYLILCNQVPELHGHAVPRFASEDAAQRKLGPFEAYDFPNARRADAGGTDCELIERLRAALRG
ncbi:MAG: hypothetical protein EA378_09315 [Phycisphaerales bacterium]|nr:MAG: hypothetical protein EA378_09315 [Phycisphaerales bacterium]